MPELLLSEAACRVSVFADHDRNPQSSCNQQRFVTKIAGGSTGINQSHAARLASIPAGEYVKLDSARLQQLSEKNDKRRLPGATY